MKPLSIRMRQTGMTTLLIAAVMLIAATLIVFVSGRSGVQEQRISANERREVEAFARAQDGLDRAMAFFKQTPRPIDMPNQMVNYHNAGGKAIPNVRARFCSPTNTNPLPQNLCPTTVDTINCPAYDPNAVYPPGHPSAGLYIPPTVVACGWSDDGSARQSVMQDFARAPAGNRILNLGSLPPLTSRSGVGATGSYTTINYFENLTVWSGDDIESGSATAKTFIRFPSSTTPSVSPHDPEYEDSYVLAAILSGSVIKNSSSGRDEYYYSGVNIPGNSNTSYLIKSTDKSSQNSYVGGDVIDKDYFLKSFTNWKEFFEYFFCEESETADAFKASLGENVMTPAKASTELGKETGQVIWVDGNFTLPNTRIGSINNPTILIVEGNLTMSSNSEFYGVIFVKGYLTGNGGPTIYGSVIVYDSGTNLSGNGAIVFDKKIVGDRISTTLRQGGQPALVAGTWRDWGGN